jgi:hypothetical protein
MSPTRSPAYQRLIDRLCTEGPVDGPTCVQQLPHITNPERALVLRENPDLLNDANISADGLADVFEGNVSAALYLSAVLEPLLRRWLFLDVCAECEANAQLADAVDVELVSSS